MQIDEKIALLEKESRLKRKIERYINGPTIKDDKVQQYTLMELHEGIQLGKVEIENQVIEFEAIKIFKERIKIPFMKDFFQIIEEIEQSALFVNNIYGITLNYVIMEAETPRTELREWSEFFRKSMLDNSLYVNIVKTEALEYIDYLCYETPTGSGRFYNVAFRVMNHNQNFVGNFSCTYKDRKTFGLLLEAILLEINCYQEDEGVNL